MTVRYEPFYSVDYRNVTHYYCGAGCGHEIGTQGPLGTGDQEVSFCSNCKEAINWQTNGKRLEKPPQAAIELRVEKLLAEGKRTRQIYAGYESNEIPCPHCGQIQNFDGENITEGEWDCEFCEKPIRIRVCVYYKVVTDDD